MFTGIIEELGAVAALERLHDAARIVIAGPLVAEGLAEGDSVAVDGCCLTVTGRKTGSFAAELMAETLDKTALGDLTPGSRVNLERALPLGDRLGGHVVQGHVDGTGVIESREHSEHWDVVTIELPAELARYVAVKGSLAVDGVSLTVSGLTDAAAGPGRCQPAAEGRVAFPLHGAHRAPQPPEAPTHPRVEVSLIPTTLRTTTLGRKHPGDRVNLEVDVLAKYVERLLGTTMANQVDRDFDDQFAHEGGGAAW